jgi:hypothetical protein
VSALVLKLVATPALIGGATLAGRRWGPAVAGWLVGLPLTSAPVALFLALDHGRAFAAAAAAGMLAGTVSQGAFSLAYSQAAKQGPWAASAAGCVGFACSTLLMAWLSLAALPALAVTVTAIFAVLRLLPALPAGPRPLSRLPRWEILLRMVVATAFVLALTASAPLLGPRLSGLLTPFPFFGALVAVFAQHHGGPAAGVAAVRGFAHGLFAPAAFLVVLASLLVPAGVPLAFAAATVACLVTQALALVSLRTRRDRAGAQ